MEIETTIADLDADPRCPVGWKVESHKKGGMLDVAKAKIGLYLSPNPRRNDRIELNKLCEELKNKKVLNANLLDWYMANPSFIPEEWKAEQVFFLGTMYCDSDGDACVRHLYWIDGRWDWSYRWLVVGWNSNHPVVVLES